MAAGNVAEICDSGRTPQVPPERLAFGWTRPNDEKSRQINNVGAIFDHEVIEDR
jgi:hypothetical protein